MQKAVFLDRDGVINEVLTKRVKFVNRPEELFLLRGVPEAVRQFNEAGWKVFIVTNQGGVGLGFMSEMDLETIHEALVEKLEEHGAHVDDIAYCSHRPDAGCRCRKPEAGMLLDLARRHDISLRDSYMVGDRVPDILAGQKAGTHTVFISSSENKTIDADYRFDSLLAFSSWLTERNCQQ
ncbi:HAD family hydrolase [Salinicoccus sp. ID82-1]|uniref:D-glycero-alpha-D-manno-heptose-1,7-bisphosphate 7-phosphatase n=1 Tax=Salinicoccus sp. ID82-1 TaxID=2820269 RepID=UPI001F1B5DE0|nr:HAD family hydrolase [Salinicoccus sp. ID82-1]MCG1010286.1 HAD family hydrolase [Salinicoccus sp. ID82-1]